MEQSNNKGELALRISGVKKQYKLGQIGGATLQAELESWWARKRGKEDPNVKIGQDQRLVGQSFMALNGVDMELYRGEAVGIIGSNGAGKSTLLKLISQVTAPTEGEIELFGRVASMLEVGTGFNGEMTGRENIYMNGAILGMSKAEIDKKIEDIIEFSEVRDFIDTPVKRYSSGMYVKLAFSVAAHLDSEIMIMDEVLAVGDMAFQKKCLEKMRDSAKTEKRAVLYVSHNMNTIRRLCDRCIVLDKGKVVFSGNVEAAIDIYLGRTDKMEAVLDLSKVKRYEKSEKGVRFDSIQILDDKSQWRINVGEMLRFSITVTAEKDVASVGYRHRIGTEGGASVTLMKAPNLFSIKAGETLTIPLEADVSQLVPGKYYLTPVLYAVDEEGNWAFYDHVDQIVSFEVDSVVGFNENMPWNYQWWGNVQFPQIKDLRE